MGRLKWDLTRYAHAEVCICLSDIESPTENRTWVNARFHDGALVVLPLPRLRSSSCSYSSAVSSRRNGAGPEDRNPPGRALPPPLLLEEEEEGG